MIKEEPYTATGYVLYCDTCGKRGPQGTSADEALDGATYDGWRTGWKRTEAGATVSVDLCSGCYSKDQITPYRLPPNRLTPPR